MISSVAVSCMKVTRGCCRNFMPLECLLVYKGNLKEMVFIFFRAQVLAKHYGTGQASGVDPCTGGNLLGGK